MFFDNSTGFQFSNNRNNLPPTFTHTFTPNDFQITDSQAMQDLGISNINHETKIKAKYGKKNSRKYDSHNILI